MTAQDEQDVAEAMDADKIDDEHDEPTGQLSYPPERPFGVNDPTADDWVSDSALTRQERTERDPSDDLGTENDTLDGEGPDLSDQLEPRVGRLVEPGADDDAISPEDVEADAIGFLVNETDLSAEEAAMHLEPE